MVVVLAFLMAFLAWPGTRVQAQTQSQTANQGQSLIAEITGEFPYVYAGPDFDSPVIATIKPGTFYYVSKQRFVYDFHKIRLAKNQDGYISSSEIKIVTAQYVKNRKKRGKAAADAASDAATDTGEDAKLAKKEKLDVRYSDHALTGNWKGHRECHIAPDWLLIYRIKDNDLLLIRTGSHSELF